MTTTHKTHHTPKRTTAILAIIFLLPAIYIFGLWVNVFSKDLTPAQKITDFTGNFPSFMSDYKILMVVSMACCIVAMILASKSFKQRLLSLRIAMWLAVMIATLIFFVDVFQLF
jgi:hypothetical protein